MILAKLAMLTTTITILIAEIAMRVAKVTHVTILIKISNAYNNVN